VNKLSVEEKAAIVEEVIGVHPRYFVYEHSKIAVDTGRMNTDGLFVDTNCLFAAGTLYKEHLKSGKVQKVL
jgi:hypothetical protein